MKNGKGSGTRILVLSGEYDLALKDQVSAAFDAVSDARRVVLDLSDVTYFDSMIIHALMRMHNARAVGGLERETIVVRNRNLFRVFEILDLASVFRVVESVDEALDKTGEDITFHHVSADNGRRGLTNGAHPRIHTTVAGPAHVGAADELKNR